ncbi:HNH endonuclease signature motif containing protein [Streptomyces sp. NPDC056670]|uniref:HNH endonuclease signature motif containing protein n=1 Tax=Streptomyces sp. NPDC056670 TaxID=3345904 RepID=UPI00369621CF
MAEVRKRRSAAERLWARLTPGAPDECWVWPGYKNPAGYGKIGVVLGVDDTGKYRVTSTYTHRVAYESRVGQIRDGYVLDHLCRNTSCCNPAHLQPVTQGTNLLRAPTSLPVINAAKTHCPQGHAYDHENTYIGTAGTRFCRRCDRDKKRSRRSSNRLPILDGAWSRHYRACVDCGTTETRHHAKGLCHNCHQRARKGRATAS